MATTLEQFVKISPDTPLDKILLKIPKEVMEEIEHNKLHDKDMTDEVYILGSWIAGTWFSNDPPTSQKRILFPVFSPLFT